MKNNGGDEPNWVQYMFIWKCFNDIAISFTHKMFLNMKKHRFLGPVEKELCKLPFHSV
jgi:hypothetical protein